MADLPQSEQDTSVFSPAARRYALSVLVVVYTFNFVDRQILSILMEPIKVDLGLSDTQLGLLTGFAFALFYATLGIPIARFADKGNRRNLIALALTVWSAMTALSGLHKTSGTCCLPESALASVKLAAVLPLTLLFLTISQQKNVLRPWASTR